MNDKLQEELAALASKLGTTMDHLWGVVIRQGPIYGVCDLVFITLLITLFILSLKQALVHREKETYEDFNPCSALWILCTGLLGVITLIVIGMELNDMLASFFNPEYWAMHDILDSIKQ